MLQPDLKGAGQIQIDLDSRRHVAGSDVIGEVRLVNAWWLNNQKSLRHLKPKSNAILRKSIGTMPWCSGSIRLI